MDDGELKKLLEENLKVSHESLKILKSINRGRMWARFFFFIKWILILSLLTIGFIKIQPYLESLSNNLERISDALLKINGFLPKQ